MEVVDVDGAAAGAMELTMTTRACLARISEGIKTFVSRPVDRRVSWPSVLSPLAVAKTPAL